MRIRCFERSGFPAANEFVRGAIDKYCGLWMEGAGRVPSAPLAKRCAVPLATKDVRVIKRAYKKVVHQRWRLKLALSPRLDCTPAVRHDNYSESGLS